MFFVLLLLFVGYIVGKKNNYDLTSFMFGIILFQFILKIFPCSYDLLYTNFHKVTFLYVMLSMLLGVLVLKFLNLCKIDNDVVSGLAFCAFLVYLFVSIKFGLSFIIYCCFSFFVGVCFCNKKNLILFLIFSLFSGFLFSADSWIIGYFLAFIAGIILNYVVSKFFSVIKYSDKKMGMLLIFGIVLSFLGVFFK